MNDKLDVFHMDYEASKKLLNYNNLGGLYEVIDIAVPAITEAEKVANAALGVIVEDKNANWQFFMIFHDFLSQLPGVTYIVS